MYYIGIDPSTSSTGYAVMDKDMNVISSGNIKGKADDPSSFANLYYQLSEVFKKYPPKIVSCENQFAKMNMSVAIKIARPVGVVLAVAGMYECRFELLPPAKWRRIYQGSNSNKEVTYEYVRKRYPDIIKDFKKDNDIADAIGIACSGIIQEKDEKENPKEKEIIPKKKKKKTTPKKKVEKNAG